jgi:hypothetical protein
MLLGWSQGHLVLPEPCIDAVLVRSAHPSACTQPHAPCLASWRCRGWLLFEHAAAQRTLGNW